MTADLFTAARVDAPARPRRPAGVSPTGRFVVDPKGGASHFVHPCGACGSDIAPFGYGVRLGEAIEKSDPKRAGRWLCATCRESIGDLE